MRLIRWLRFHFGMNWWVARHVLSGPGCWFPWKVQSIFGYPLTTMFFKVVGPFESEDDAAEWTAQQNEKERARGQKGGV